MLFFQFRKSFETATGICKFSHISSSQNWGAALLCFNVLRNKPRTVADRRLPSSPRASMVLKYIAQLSENLNPRLRKSSSRMPVSCQLRKEEG